MQYSGRRRRAMRPGHLQRCFVDAFLRPEGFCFNALCSLFLCCAQLLRSSLVNNRTQAKVAEELGMQEFAITNDKTKRPVVLRTKTLADLLECKLPLFMGGEGKLPVFTCKRLPEDRVLIPLIFLCPSQSRTLPSRTPLFPFMLLTPAPQKKARFL